MHIKNICIKRQLQDGNIVSKSNISLPRWQFLFLLSFLLHFNGVLSSSLFLSFNTHAALLQTEELFFHITRFVRFQIFYK